MQTYFSDVEELWGKIQEVGGSMVKDFELTKYGDQPEEVTGYALMYSGITHDIYKVNKTVEMLYNKLKNNGLKNNIHLVKRNIHKTEKYKEAKEEYVIELYPGMYKA
ncbi:MAG TPA: hypothetical protein VJ824_04830 [Bacillota bacterium]|nr:hypothetical protein [Bacillota bacterium]